MCYQYAHDQGAGGDLVRAIGGYPDLPKKIETTPAPAAPTAPQVVDPLNDSAPSVSRRQSLIISQSTGGASTATANTLGGAGTSSGLNTPTA